MTCVTHSARPIRTCVVSIALGIGVSSVSASLDRRPAPDQGPVNAGTTLPSKRMADGNEWTTANLNVNTSPSSCYDDAERNCRQYGRLYTWESAQRACRSLGDRWRLPTDAEWLQLAKQYGGLGNDSPDNGKASYTVLVSGGKSGFGAVLGGMREVDGTYSRLEAHGFYWTASEGNPKTAPFYNFGKGSAALYRQAGSEKQRAFSVRCIRE